MSKYEYIIKYIIYNVYTMLYISLVYCELIIIYYKLFIYFNWKRKKGKKNI